jgi:hypothetical protein
MKAINRVQEITSGFLFAILTVSQLRGLILGSPKIEPTTRKNPKGAGSSKAWKSVKRLFLMGSGLTLEFSHYLPYGSGSSTKVSALSRAWSGAPCLHSEKSAISLSLKKTLSSPTQAYC